MKERIRKWKEMFKATLSMHQNLSVHYAIFQWMAMVHVYGLKGTEALYPELRDRFEELEERMRKRGMKLKVVETFRDANKQNELFKKDPPVTNAKALQSYHQYYLAVDVCFLNYGWNPPGNEWWWALDKEARDLGLETGLKWGDKGHIVYRPQKATGSKLTWNDLKPHLELF